MNRKLLSAGVIVTQLTDAISTLNAVSIEGVSEANPVMDIVLQQGAVTFVATKATLGVLLAVWLSKKPPARSLLFIGVFSLVSLWNTWLYYAMGG